MPIIPKFKTDNKIDTRVEAASIERSGTVAVPRALQRLGQVGAGIANELLIEERNEESKRTRVELGNKLTEDGNNMWTELTTDKEFNPASGKLRGANVYEMHKKYMDGRREELLEEAPHNHAKRFANDKLTQIQSGFESGTYTTYQAIKAEGKEIELDQVSEEGEKAVISTPGPGQTHFSRGHDFLQGMKELVESNGALNTLQQDVKFVEKARPVADRAIQTMFATKKWGQAVRSAKLWDFWDGSDKELNKIFGSAVKETFGEGALVTKTNGKPVVWDPGRNVEATVSKDGKRLNVKILNQKDHELPRIVFDMKDINIDALKEGPNLLHDAISGEQKIGYLRALLRGTKEEERENMVALNNRINNTLTALRSTGSNKSRWTHPAVEKDLRNLFSEIDNKFKNKDRAREAKINIFAAGFEGLAFDNMALATQEEGNSLINNLRGNVLTKMKQWIPDFDPNTHEGKRATETVMGRLKAAQTRALENQKFGAYIANQLPEKHPFKKLHAEKHVKNGDKYMESFKGYMKKYNKGLSEQTPFTKKELQEDIAIIEHSLRNNDPSTAMDKIFEKYRSYGKDYYSDYLEPLIAAGFDKRYAALLLVDPSTKQARRTGRELIEGLRNFDVNKKILPVSTPINAFRAEIDTQTSDLTVHAMNRGLSIGDSETSQGIRDAVMAVAVDDYLKNGGSRSVKEVVGNAYKRVFLDHIVVSRASGKPVSVGKRAMQDAGIRSAHHYNAAVKAMTDKNKIITESNIKEIPEVKKFIEDAGVRPADENKFVRDMLDDKIFDIVPAGDDRGLKYYIVRPDGSSSKLNGKGSKDELHFKYKDFAEHPDTIQHLKDQRPETEKFIDWLNNLSKKMGITE